MLAFDWKMQGGKIFVWILAIFATLFSIKQYEIFRKMYKPVICPSWRLVVQFNGENNRKISD